MIVQLSHKNHLQPGPMKKLNVIESVWTDLIPSDPGPHAKEHIRMQAVSVMACWVVF